jgi:hypothetical protein
MRGRVVARSLVLVVAAVFAANQASAQAQGPGPRSPALVLPVAGTTSAGGTFTGTLSVQRFASRNNQTVIVAVGMIAGTVRDAAGAPVGTLLNGPVEVPVAASQAFSGLAPSGRAIRPAGGPSPAAPRSVTLVQAQQTCGVLHLEFGAITLNVLGVVVTTNPIVLDISGETGGTALLGTLVCQILGALTGAVNLLVGLLNTLLGLLGGLTGGLSA